MHPRQMEIDWWRSRFDILYQWEIKYSESDKFYCTTRYDIENKRAIIYSCDIDQENDYILYQILKLAYLESRSKPESADKFLEDLTTLITDRSIRE